MQAVFEELCVQMILPQLPPQFVLRVLIEYSQEHEDVSMQFFYDGERLDPRERGNALSMKLIDNAADTVEYSQIAEAPYTNRIRLTIR